MGRVTPDRVDDVEMGMGPGIEVDPVVAGGRTCKEDRRYRRSN